MIKKKKLKVETSSSHDSLENTDFCEPSVLQNNYAIKFSIIFVIHWKISSKVCHEHKNVISRSGPDVRHSFIVFVFIIFQQYYQNKFWQFDKVCGKNKSEIWAYNCFIFNLFGSLIANSDVENFNFHWLKLNTKNCKLSLIVKFGILSAFFWLCCITLCYKNRFKHEKIHPNYEFPQKISIFFLNS